MRTGRRKAGVATGRGCALACLPHGSGRAGFAMSLEAACSLLLLAFSLGMLPYLSLPSPDAQGFFLCSDAALLLAKTGSFSDEALLARNVDDASSLSGMCIGASAGRAFASSGCGGAISGRFAFRLPVWSGGGLKDALVSCDFQA